jgi:hypothetical protein
MKKLIFILFLFVFASSASATLYKWVDERGVVNFADDLDKVPPIYRNSIEELKAPKMPTQPFFQVPPEKTVVNTQSGKASTQAPPIAQTLIREGDFAMKLVNRLQLGTAQNEAEAESTLASSGIAPKNGWIADYPVTPDIIGELQKAISDAADSGRLAIAKDEAMKTFQDLTAEAGLSVTGSAQDEYAGNEPPSSYGDYSNPDVIDNYYHNEGPPIVTYYPPPSDYYYMYAWVPYPFWCSGFWFPGFFVLHDFDKIVVINHRHHRFTNHFFHPRWRSTVTIDPGRRGTERPFRATSDNPRTRGYSSPEARTGASSIFERSRDRTRTGGAAVVRPDRGPNDKGPSSRPISNTPALRGRSSDQTRPPTSERRMSRPPGESNLGGSGAPRSPRDMPGRTYAPPPNIDRRSGMNSPRPSSGEVRSFSPPAQGSPRSSNTPPVGGGASLGIPQSGGRNGGSGARF